MRCLVQFIGMSNKNANTKFRCNSSGASANRERLAYKVSSQSGQHAMTLLTHPRLIAADGAKGRRPCFTTKGACNLMFGFDHGQIPFRLIIGEWNAQIFQKRQYLVYSQQKSIQ